MEGRMKQVAWKGECGTWRGRKVEDGVEGKLKSRIVLTSGLGLARRQLTGTEQDNP